MYRRAEPTPTRALAARLTPVLAVGFFLTALAALLAFGVLGIGRSGPLNSDGLVLFAAGRAWLAGLDPYNHAELTRALPEMTAQLSWLRFFYLPQSAVMFVPLALLPYGAARYVWLALNLLAIAALVALVAATMKQRRRQVSAARPDAPGRWVLAAVIIGNPFTLHVVWMGQTSLVAFAALMAAWVLSRRGRWLAAGLCLALASYKPQLCLLVGLWLLLERDWKTLLTAGLGALAMAAYPFATRGPVATLLDWQRGVSGDYGLIFNQPGFPSKVGLESVLHAAGVVGIPGSVFIGLGVVLTLVLWAFRDRIDPHDWLALLMALTLTFSGHAHDHDYVGLVPLFASLWWYARERRLASVAAPPRWSRLTLLFGLLLFVPQRLLRPLDLPVLNHWRTIVLILLAVAVLALASGGRRAPSLDQRLGLPRTT